MIKIVIKIVLVKQSMIPVVYVQKVTVVIPLIVTLIVTVIVSV